jgi:hypothetical protein
MRTRKPATPVLPNLAEIQNSLQFGIGIVDDFVNSLEPHDGFVVLRGQVDIDPLVFDTTQTKEQA